MTKKTKDNNEELVAVEMTPEELTEYTEHKLQKEKAAALAALTPKERTAKINLWTKHTFGHRSYGPGETWVPEGIVGQLAYQDQKAEQRENDLNRSKKKNRRVFQSGQSIEVKE